MKLFFDIFPVLVFFITFKLFDIYVATLLTMLAALGQMLFFWLKYRRLEQVQVLSMIFIFIFGGATLAFHDPSFIKLKPTGVYWLTGIIFLASYLFGKKTLIQKMMDKNFSLPPKNWYYLNHMWTLFFIVMGFLNLYVAYTCNTNTWVNFKLFGGLGLTLLFVVLQSFYLIKHIEKKEQKVSSPSSIR